MKANLAAALALAMSSAAPKMPVGFGHAVTKRSGSYTKRGPGREHTESRGKDRRALSKTARHLLKSRHVMSDYMIGKSPVGSMKGGA